MVASPIKFIEHRKWWIICCLALSILLVSVFIPRWLFKFHIGKMGLEKVERIEYVEYEGDPFCSSIKIKKVASRGDNRNTINDFLDKISRVNKKERAMNNSNKVLFFYYDNGKILNAYIKDNYLGFNYGKTWLEIKELENTIDSMNFVELLKFKNDGRTK